MSDQLPEVITAGSINADFIVGVGRLPVAGETVAGNRVVRGGGGKAANQAIAASRYGAAVSLLGAVGDDELGRAALQDLSAEGVSVTACRVLEGDTGLALIVVDESGENQIAVAPGVVERVDVPLVRDMLGELDTRSASVCLLSLELPDAAILEVAGWASELGLRLIVDPAPARALPHGLLAYHPILTPNASEAALLSGVADPEEGAARLSARSQAPVIVTMGADGALLSTEGRVSAIAPIEVAAVDTTGAGDALDGILAAELARGLGLEEALRSAMIGAALSTLSAGAREGFPTREAVAVWRFEA